MLRSRSVNSKFSSSSHHDGGGSLRWLLTYADMITLLLAFFIMLYSMSILNLAKFKQVAVSIKSGFGGVVDGTGQTIMGESGMISLQPTAIAGDTAGVPFTLIKEIQRNINERDLRDSVKMYSDDRGLVINLLSERLLFPMASAQINDEARPILENVAELLRQIPNPVRIEGHTCSLPINTPQFPSNWELSTARATQVVRFMVEQGGVPANRLSAAGYADTHPIASNDTAENRETNRRVEVVILRDFPHPADQ